MNCPTTNKDTFQRHATGNNAFRIWGFCWGVSSSTPQNCPTTNKDTFQRHATGNEWLPYYELTGCVMPEFTSSPIFLIIAAIFAVLLLIGIVKGAVRFLIWVAIIAVILIGLGMMTQEDLRDWFENLLKTVTG